MKKAFLLLFLAAFVAADCVFVSVSLLDEAIVEKGVQAAYPITLTNTGLSSTLVRLSGYCPSGVDCQFNPSPAFVTLTPSQSETFNLLADTNDAAVGLHSIDLEVSVGSVYTPCFEAELSLEVLAEPQPSVTPDSFTVTVEPESLNASGWAGDVMEFTISIENNEPNTGYAELSMEGPFAESTSFSASKVTVPAASTKEVIARVTIPPGTPGSVYANAFIVEATIGGACCEQQYALPLDVCVFADELYLEVLNEPVLCTQVTHEEETIIALELRNTGEISGPFHAYLVGSNEALSMMELSSSLIEIAPGDREPLFISILPSSSAVLDTYYYSLKIDYLGYTVYDAPYCFTVSGVEDFSLEFNESAIIRRCKIETVPFTLMNNGTLFDDYEIEVEAIDGLLVQPVPSSFSLSPGQSKAIDFVFSTTLNEAPELGWHDLGFTVRSRRVTQAYELPFLLVSSEEQGESFLYLAPASDLTLVAGAHSVIVFAVYNSGGEDLHYVELEVEGIDEPHYAVETVPQDIPAGESRNYEVSFYLPQTEESFIDLSFRAYSQVTSEAVKEDYSVPITQLPVNSLGVVVSNAAQEEEGALIIEVIVSNAGLTPLSGVQPAITGYVVAAQPAYFDLQPGESRSMTLRVGDYSGGEVQVQLSTAEGVLSEVTSISVEPKEESIPWAMIAILGIVVVFLAYGFIVKRGDDECDLVAPEFPSAKLEDYDEA